MRSITYAGETLLTTDDVAEALIALTAAIANEGRSKAVCIPIVTASDESGEAELVIGVGNDVLSAPAESTAEAPDFTEAAEELRSHPSYPREREAGAAADGIAVDESSGWDPDLEGFYPLR